MNKKMQPFALHKIHQLPGGLCITNKSFPAWFLYFKAWKWVLKINHWNQPNKLALEAPLLLLALMTATAPPLLLLAEPFKRSWAPLAGATEPLASWAAAGEDLGVFPWAPLFTCGSKSSVPASSSSAIGNGVGGWEMEKRPLLKGAGEPEGVLGVETGDEAPGGCWAGQFWGDFFSS